MELYLRRQHEATPNGIRQCSVLTVSSWMCFVARSNLFYPLQAEFSPTLIEIVSKRCVAGNSKKGGGEGGREGGRGAWIYTRQMGGRKGVGDSWIEMEESPDFFFGGGGRDRKAKNCMRETGRSFKNADMQIIIVTPSPFNLPPVLFIRFIHKHGC